MEHEEIKRAVLPKGIDSARVTQVIETRSVIGRGTSEDPVRRIVQYWDFEGNLLWSTDE